MNLLTVMILCALSAEIGWLASWYCFDRWFYKPQSKMLREVLDAWEKTLDIQIEFWQRQTENLPIISPIQIKKDES